MNWAVHELNKINSNSTIKCVHGKVIFPKEYDKCPQCEVDELWQTIKTQFENNFGGLQN